MIAACFIILTLANDGTPLIVNTENIVAIYDKGETSQLSLIEGFSKRSEVNENIFEIQQKLERCDAVEMVL